MTENNKVIYDGQTLIDLTQDDVTASDVRNGVYFHSADGVRGQGTLTSTSTPTADTIAEWDSDVHMNSEDMTSQEVEDFVDSLNVAGINAVDYIVEQGTSGIWTYRKWASGVAECWGTKTATLTGSSAVAPFSGYCYAFGAIAFPSALFNATPVVNVNGKRSSNYVVVSYCSPSSTGVSVELQSSISGSASCSAYIHAVGTWK